MGAEWAGIVNTTAQKYLKGAQDLTIRERLLLAMLRKRGRIKLNRSGRELTWQLEISQQNVSAYGDGGTLEFQRSNRYRQMTTNWRGYKATDSMSTKETLMNKGNEALINRYAEIMPSLEKSITDKFGTELYIDGNAAGNENRLCGLDSFTGYTAPSASDLIAIPNDDYAGKATDVATFGGTWSTDMTTKPNATIATDWPYGKGSSEYDATSPKLVKYNSTGWATGSTSWEDNCEKVLRATTNWLTLTSGRSGRPTLYMIAGEMYVDLLNHFSAKQRVIIPHKESQDLGFEGVLNFDGVGVYEEFGIAAEVGYGLNLNEMTLESLAGQLFIAKGPEYDMRTDSFLFMIGFFGNCTFNPKAFAKLGKFA